MNCCNDYGKCTQGQDCPARAAAVARAPVFQDPNEHSPLREVVRYHTSPWVWIWIGICQLLQALLCAVVAVCIVCGGLGFIYGRWVL